MILVEQVFPACRAGLPNLAALVSVSVVMFAGTIIVMYVSKDKHLVTII
jgi:hypothetical protein